MEPMHQIIAPVISSEEIIPGTFLTWVEAPQIAAETNPGQFVTVRCSEGSNPLLRRPLSIHRMSNEKLALLFAVVGQGTEWLASRQKGDQLDLLGPLGNGFAVNPNSRNLLLVAGGIGVAPLIGLAEKATSKGLAVKLLMGAANATCLYPLRDEKIETLCTTDDGSSGSKGLVTEHLSNYLDWADQVFACGPIPMYRSMAQMEALRHKPTQIILEQVMGCGVGACYGCTVMTTAGPKMVCRDGPVFDLGEIVWEEIVEPKRSPSARQA